jgi:hypothetical protein
VVNITPPWKWITGRLRCMTSHPCNTPEAMYVKDDDRTSVTRAIRTTGRKGGGKGCWGDGNYPPYRY